MTVRVKNRDMSVDEHSSRRQRPCRHLLQPVLAVRRTFSFGPQPLSGRQANAGVGRRRAPEHHGQLFVAYRTATAATAADRRRRQRRRRRRSVVLIERHPTPVAGVDLKPRVD